MNMHQVKNTVTIHIHTIRILVTIVAVQMEAMTKMPRIRTIQMPGATGLVPVKNIRSSKSVKTAHNLAQTEAKKLQELEEQLEKVQHK